MMGYWLTAATLVAVAVVLVLLVRKNLSHRDKARQLRSIFIAQANDLVAKPDFPEAHARLLISMSAIPEGWATRFFVISLVKSLIFGGSPPSGNAPRLENVPAQYRKKYVIAMLAFALSDSYRTVVFGRVFRSINSWLADAINEPKVDVDAHATKVVIDHVSTASRRTQPRESSLVPA